MKKSLSTVLSLCMAFGAISVPAHAAEEDVILSVADAVFTIDGTEYPTAVNGNWYGVNPTALGLEETETARAAKVNSYNANTFITYTGIPAGTYEVYYWIPANHETYPLSRSAQIVDVDVTVNYGGESDTVYSIKDHAYLEGYKEIGTYTFAGEGDSIVVKENEENFIVSAHAGQKCLTSVKVKLVPYEEKHGDLLSAVNSADSAQAIETAVETLGTGFVDSDALNYMGGVYETLYTEKTAAAFANSHEFKKAFDAAVYESLTAVTYSYDQFAWRTVGEISQDSAYRTNRANTQFYVVQGGEVKKGEAILSFKDITKGNIKKLELDLNATTLSSNAVISKVSGDAIEIPANAQTSDLYKNAAFTELTDATKILNTKKELSDADGKIKNAINENGYLHLYVDGEDFGASNNQTNYFNQYEDNGETPRAALTVYYDNTSNPNVSLTSSEVNNGAANVSKVFDMSAFGTITEVKVNGNVLTADDYSVCENRLKIDGEFFPTAGTYMISVSDGSETRTVTETVKAAIVLENPTITIPETGAVKNGSNSTGTYNGELVSREWEMAGTAESIDQVHFTSADAAAATYAEFDANSVPAGVYKVEQHITKFTNTSNPNSRSKAIVDTDVTITDKNGTHEIISTKPNLQYQGSWVELGEFEFAENGNSIKVMPNKDNWLVQGNYVNMFAPSGIRLTPAADEEIIDYYFNHGKTYTEAVNEAATAEALAAVAQENSFVDSAALKNMSGIYASLLGTDYESEYAFKTAFEEAVNAYLEANKVEYTAQMLSTTNDGASYRSSDSNLLSVPNKEKSRIRTIFKDVDNENVHSVTFKMPYNFADAGTTKTMKANILINSVSYVKYDRVTDSTYDQNVAADAEKIAAAKEWEGTFEEYSQKLHMSSATSIDKSVLAQMGEDKYISFGVTADIDVLYTENVSMNGEHVYNPAILTVYYDNTDAEEPAMTKLQAAASAASADDLAAAETIVSDNAAVLGLSGYTNVKPYAIALFGEVIESEADVDAIFAKAAVREVILSGLKKTDGGYAVTVKNLSSSENPITLIAAEYSADGMQKVSMSFEPAKEKIAGYSVEEFTFNLSASAGNTLKVFAVDNLTGLKPYDEAVQLTAE